MDRPLNLSEFAKHFSDESATYRLVERIRWPNGPVCPHCGSVDRAMYLEPQNGYRKTRAGNTTYRRVWKCKDCRQQFSVLVGTIFEDSHIPLSKWLLAIHMLCSAKNGVAALELSRTLGLAYRSAWFMAHRVREAMTRPPLADKLAGIVEADETYVKAGRRTSKPVRGWPGTDSGKVRVLTLVERGGEARSRALKRVTGKNIGDALHENVRRARQLSRRILCPVETVDRQHTPSRVGAAPTALPGRVRLPLQQPQDSRRGAHGPGDTTDGGEATAL